MIDCTFCQLASNNYEILQRIDTSIAPLDSSEFPPPPPPPPVKDEIFRPVRYEPVFQGCKNQNLSNKELEECEKKGMLDYIYENLVYPEEAKKNCTEGMVVVQFAVGKCGDMQNIRVVRDIGDGCGEAAMSVISKMLDECLLIAPKRVNGTSRGRPSKIQYTLPIKFELGDD